ncbi:uncharacterized protein LOC130711909 isoform X2 [Lotus japonicus]|uniref:uncharacterized protein LOC130711909 isoform X2 n=1 Tax=Lotus japonicus TaxID=34305 RepID=UPI00258D315C|nr:uncharacterized protein LOC130711909 isoform X2 [Lotus japonicus]
MKVEDSKRWTVTYTKQIKQKRKVYQDGFLELHIPTTKVKLFDECEKLLTCRLLKNDESVTSGETMEFNGYLVDIGDPEGGNYKTGSDLNVDIKHKNASRFKTPCGIKMNGKENIARAQKPLSPSRKIIKEFKKRELLKYVSPKVSQDTPKPSTKEWQVLYTKHMTQKAKKYHDGFLRLVICGSQGAQVKLFDSSRNLLDSRFLKKDETIISGESIAFDAHLVDIGEDQGSNTPDSCVQGVNCSNAERVGKMERKQTSLDTDAHVNVGKSEWRVLYTTQLTQKAKKYHDGFLQLELCGSLGRQVVLCDISKRPLERRFLKKDEVIKVGESVHFGGHLVNVEEPEGSQQCPVKLNDRGIGNNVVERRQLRQVQNGCHKVNPSFAVNPSVINIEEPEGSQQCPVKLNDRGIGNNVVERRQLRQVQNGCHKANPSFAVNPSVINIEEPEGSQQCPVKLNDREIGNNVSERRQVRQVQNGYHNVNPSVTQGQPAKRPCLGQDAGLNSLFARIEEIKSNGVVPPIKPFRDASQILSILQDPKHQESYGTGAQSSNGSRESGMVRESTETVETHNIMSSKEACGGGGFQFTENVNMSHQVHSDKEAQTHISEADFDLLISSSGDHSHCLISNEEMSDEEFSCKSDAFPSFDLGF